MQGYHNKPVENRSGIAKRAGYHTGDPRQGSDPNGYLTIPPDASRKFDHPGPDRTSRRAEIEEVAILHPEVIDLRGGRRGRMRRLGEVPYLFVVAEKKKRASSTWKSLLAHCRASLSSYKIPGSHPTSFLKFPAPVSGKIMRFKAWWKR